MSDSAACLYHRTDKNIIGGLHVTPRRRISMLWDWEKPWDKPYYVQYTAGTTRNVLHTGGGVVYVKVMTSGPERALIIAKHHYCFGHDHNLVDINDVPVELQKYLIEMKSNSDYL